MEKVETLDGIKFWLDNPGGKDEAKCRENVAAAARVGHGAAAADLFRVVLEGVGEEAAGGGAGLRDEFRKLRVPGLAWRPDQPGIVLRAHRYFHIYGIGAILSCMKPASVRTTVDIPAHLYGSSRNKPQPGAVPCVSWCWRGRKVPF